LTPYLPAEALETRAGRDKACASAFQDNGRVARRPAHDRPLELELQNIGTDPRLCRQIGNETHCY
jgi:hypothetical protein